MIFLWSIILNLSWCFFIQEGNFILFFLLLGGFLGFALTFSISNRYSWNIYDGIMWSIKGAMVSGVFGSGVQFIDHYAETNNIKDSGSLLILGGVGSVIILIITSKITNQIRLNIRNQKFSSLFANTLLANIIFLSCSIGYGVADSFDLLASWAVGISSIGLLAIVSHHSNSRNKMIARYRQLQHKLIEP